MAQTMRIATLTADQQAQLKVVNDAVTSARAALRTALAAQAATQKTILDSFSGSVGPCNNGQRTFTRASFDPASNSVIIREGTESCA